MKTNSRMITAKNNVEFSINDPEAFLQAVQTAAFEGAKRALGKESSSNAPYDMNSAAAYLKVTKPTLYAKTASGAISFMKVGKKIYFTEQMLMDYLASGTRRSKTEVAEVAHTFLK